jgi:hypothetical protein
MCLICSPGQGEYLLNIWCTSKVLVVDRGSMFCNKIRGRMFFFFFDIDVKGGEKSSGGESSPNACGCLCCHQCQRGRLLANILTDNECLSLMASTTMKMA